MFEKFLKRSSWTDIVISIIFVFFGILLIVKPNEMISAISIIFGLIFIAMGILKLIEYFASDDKPDYLLSLALILVVFGVIILFCSDVILSVFRVLLGVWIILAGVMDFQTTLIWKEVKSPYWTASLIISMAMIVAGIVVIVSSDILFTTIGIITIVYAILDIIDRIIFMKKMDNYLKD